MCSPRIRRRKPRRARPFGRLPPSCAGASAYDPAEVGRPPWAGGGAVVPAQHHSPLFLLVANPGGGRGLMGGLPITGTPGGWAGTPRRPGPQGANLRPREGQTLVTSSRGRPPPGRPAAPGPAPRRSRSPSATGRCSASGSPACPWRRSPPPCRIPPQSVLCGGGGPISTQPMHSEQSQCSKPNFKVSAGLSRCTVCGGFNYVVQRLPNRPTHEDE